MKCQLPALIASSLAWVAGSCFGETPKSAPSELGSLLAPDETLVIFRRADLNGDGRQDFIFVVQTPSKGTKDECFKANRTLRIALRQANNTLRVVKSNSRSIMCHEDGGVFGDPLDSIKGNARGFVISHAGGGNCRWASQFTFLYSRKDADWYLLHAYHSQSHACEPESRRAHTVQQFRYPEQFPRIMFADFDAEIMGTLLAKGHAP